MALKPPSCPRTRASSHRAKGRPPGPAVYIAQRRCAAGMRSGGGRKGFSLVELLTAVAILGVLSSVAVVSYGGWKKAGADTYLKHELTRISGFLKMARIQDRGFHQYIYHMGYRPAMPLQGNAGFFDTYAFGGSYSTLHSRWNDRTGNCCADYPGRGSGTPAERSLLKAEYSHLKTLPFPKITSTIDGSDILNFTENARSIAVNWLKATGGPEIQKGNVYIKETFSGNGIAGNAAADGCPFYSASAKINCSCSEFKIAGVTRYKNFFAANPAPSALGAGSGKIFILNERDELCFADSSTGKKLKKL